MQHPASVIVTDLGVRILVNYEDEPRDCIDGAFDRDANDPAEDVVHSMLAAGR